MPLINVRQNTGCPTLLLRFSPWMEPTPTLSLCQTHTKYRSESLLSREMVEKARRQKG